MDIKASAGAAGVRNVRNGIPYGRRLIEIFQPFNSEVSPGEHRRLFPISSIVQTQEFRLQAGIEELNRVLGGGVVPGSVILIGGDPGIGKTTLLLQTLASLGTAKQVGLYVSGEESPQQIKMRADRIGIQSAQPVCGCCDLPGRNF